MRAVILAATLIALGLSGCSSMRPLYGSSGLSSGVSSELSSIAIPEPRTRLEQLIRNDLVAAMRPAGTVSGDRYTLVLKPEAKDDTAIEGETTDTLRKTVRLNVGFNLVDRRTSDSVFSGRTFERAAHEVSSDIRTRLAAHFASG
jgi:LPS-assembly lipoprotein